MQRDLFTTTILSVFRANGRMIQWGDRFAAPFAVTSARWQVLGALGIAAHPLTAPQIAVNMGVTRQGVQKQLNVLLQEGLIEKHVNPYHKRSPYYRLSAVGSDLYARIDHAWDRHAEQMMTRFAPGELSLAIQVLERISDLHNS
ncbi:MAG: MarR family transcriptional regulator [Magnetococcales bacterium]|nr:winged helix-turn-helix transcriptional regulator [Magnetococcales bacterium]NGZ05318.1 MarR family transcriptional regulator [Magnetococcales bacterium]